MLRDLKATAPQVERLSNWARLHPGAADVEVRLFRGVLVAGQGEDRAQWDRDGEEVSEPVFEEANPRSWNFWRLAAAFDPANLGEQNLELRRYAAVAERLTSSGETIGAVIWLRDTVDECLSQLGEAALDRLVPEGIYDLDTGGKTGLHVATPVVTPSEEQSVMLNPLELRAAGPARPAT